MLSRVSLPGAGSQCKIAGRATARDINLIEKVCIAHVKANVASIRDKISELDPTRSHHMNLEVALTGARVEYRAVKLLRNEPGFAWDEATQMVIASPQTWDAYIAVRPFSPT